MNAAIPVNPRADAEPLEWTAPSKAGLLQGCRDCRESRTGYRATSVSTTAHDLGLDTIPHWHTTPVGGFNLLNRGVHRQALYGTVRAVLSKSFLLRQKQAMKSSVKPVRRDVLYVGAN